MSGRGPEVLILIIYTKFIGDFLLWEGSWGLQTVYFARNLALGLV